MVSAPWAPLAWDHSMAAQPCVGAPPEATTGKESARAGTWAIPAVINTAKTARRAAVRVACNFHSPCVAIRPDRFRGSTAPARTPASSADVAGSRCAGRVGHVRLRVGVRHTDLTLEPVGVAEEQRENRAEVGHELVGCAPLDQPAADLFERIKGRCLQSQVVDAASAEHGCLALGLGVAVHLEEIDLGLVADADKRQHALVAHVLLTIDLGAEDLAVEVDEPLRVGGENRDVVEPVCEHRRPPRWPYP